MFAIEHANVLPDAIAAAKGIASGLPLGVAMARADAMDTWPPGAHASTFGGNPVACAAAIATLKLLQDSLMANAATVGLHMMAGLEALAGKHPLIGDVRGRGLMIGVELVRDRQTKERAGRERDAVVLAAFRRGLLLLGAGANSIRFAPPLVLTRGGTSLAPAIATTGLPSAATASTPARGGDASARRALAGAMLAGPIADRPVVSYVRPLYPEWAKRDAVEGRVTLYFVVGPDGSVRENVLVQKTAGFEDFDESARTALRMWRFAPLREGRTGEQWGTITFHFRLQEAG
jgi:TonB family protein